MSVTVLKLGGSLLDLPELAIRLMQVINQFDDGCPLLICGGGAAADVVRKWSRDFRLVEEKAHWLALEAIRLNQALLLELLPELQLVSNRAAAESVWSGGGVPLLDLKAFMSIEESQFASDPKFQPLPHTWDVTSDSLAAWVTLRWPAQRLVLLKSVDRPDSKPDEIPNSLGDTVDAYFEKLQPRIPVLEWINLRRMSG